jgi:hypothetical protein
LVNSNISVKIFDDRLCHHRTPARGSRSSTEAPITEERTAVFKTLSGHATASSAPPAATLK